MKNPFTKLLTASLLLGAFSAQGAVTINFQNFSDPVGGSTATITATDGDDPAIVTSATLGTTGLSVIGTGITLKVEGISNTYDDWRSFTFSTSTPVIINETSFYYDFVNGNRDNRFTQVSVFKLDNNNGVTVLDSMTLPEVNTGTVDIAIITDAIVGLDSGTLFEVRFALKASETWGDQTMDNLSVTMAVPEPATYALLLRFVALGGVMLRRRLRS